VVIGAPSGKKRSLFGRIAVDEDPEDVDAAEVESFDGETHSGEVEDFNQPASENLDDLN
jgi:hypothetical protein